MNWLWRINKKLGGRVISMMLIALALSLVAVIFTDTWISAVKTQSEKIIEIKMNVIALRQMKAHLFEAESAQRGFILTQREGYIALLNKAIESARERIRSIGRLVSENGSLVSDEEEKRWVLALSASLESKISEMQLTALLVRQGKIKEATQIVATNKGMVDTQKILQMIDDMSAVQDKAAYAVKLQRDTTLAWARASIYGSALVLMLLVILVIRQLLKEMATRDQLREQLNEELRNYETQLDERTKLLKALAIDAQTDVERERQKLARELHDELGSILTATKMDVSWAIRKARESVPEVSEKLSKTIRYLDQGIQFKREVVQRLRPSMIETFGFWTALRALIDDVAERNQWEMDLILPDETAEISEIVSLITYRVIQETLNNATKYAEASKFSLHMLIELGYLKLELEDDGVGMDQEHMVEGATHGLKGMKNRVMAIGGSFDLTSSPGQGVTTIVMIPLDTAHESIDTQRDIARDAARDLTRDAQRDAKIDAERDS